MLGIVRVTEEKGLVRVPLPPSERQIKILLPVTLQMRLLVGGQRRKEEKKRNKCDAPKPYA